MYWLIGSLIVIVMMGVLAIADSVPMSIHPPLVDIASTPILFLLLITLSIILMMFIQFNIPAISLHHSRRSFSTATRTITSIATNILIAILAIGLVSVSALHAMISHQQTKAAEITDPMRVQALVRIEGISDSIYDATTDSGYRQVAIISHISPLISNLTEQDLDDITDKHIKNQSNSLSRNYDHGDNAYKFNSKDNIYRVLLNAYPKSPSKTSFGKPANDDQLIRLNHLKPGDEIFMSLSLGSLANVEQTINNPSGFNSYRWLKGRHIDGVANILASSTSTINSTNVNSTNINNAKSSIVASFNLYLQSFKTCIDQGRWQLRQHFYENWAELTVKDQQAKAVTLSLLTGDRSLISRDTKDLYQLAGISHLLAISGMHILFLTIMLSGVVVLVFDRLYPMVYRAVPRWQIRWWVMVGAAFIYALFTGFDVPAARTAWMLLALGLVRLTLLPISTIRVLFALAVLMAWHDPYVLWQAGYWLSFIAVALLLKYDDTSYRYAQSDTTKKTGVMKSFFKRAWLASKRLFKLQLWLFITLLPVTLLLFGKASLWGLIINLFAIGLFGCVIVPLNLLAGLCYLLSPAIADNIWTLVSTIVAGLHELVIWLTSLPAMSKAWLYTPVNLAIVLMVLLSILPWLLPRGFISRWLALPPLTLLMMTVYANQQSLKTLPTLYILPTGDHYVSAALLQYPIVNNDRASKDKNVNWLFLADHRSTTTRTLPSRLTVDKLSKTLEQQLGSLSIDKLEGIVVQSSHAELTTTLTDDKRTTFDASVSALLPMTVTQLGMHLPINQYWQAGRSDRLLDLQQAYKAINHSNSKANITVQHCEQGKTWQLPDKDLTIQAMTGWSEIDDASVWDCTVAIDTNLPIQVLRYDASDPLKSLPVTVQTRTSENHSPALQTENMSSRLILNIDTHPRIWQMWSLLWADDLSNDKGILNHTTWLGHITSHITADVIRHQNINEIMTYDNQGLEAALSLENIDVVAP